MGNARRDDDDDSQLYDRARNATCACEEVDLAGDREIERTDLRKAVKSFFAIDSCE